MMYKIVSALILLVTASFVTANDALNDAITADHRDSSVTRDIYRNPRETLSFFQVMPDHKVLEVTPGGSGWYTEILAPYLRDKGSLFIGHFDPNSTSNYYRKNYKKLIDKFEEDPDLYDRVEIGVFAPPGLYKLGDAGTFDRVVTFRNIHNWTKHGDDEMKRIFSEFFNALKPGGKLGVIDHRLPENRDENSKGGYVKQSYVIGLAEAVGFKLEGASEINANPKDPADAATGVWRLLPSLSRGSYEDKLKNMAIGESDRMTLLFVKPE